MSAVTLRSPGRPSLLEACRSFVLPHVTFSAVAVLALGSLAFAVLGLAARSAVRQLRASHRFLDRLTGLRPAPVGPAGTAVLRHAAAGVLRRPAAPTDLPLRRDASAVER